MAEVGKTVVLRVCNVASSAGSAASFFAFAGQKDFTITRETPTIATDAKGDTNVTNEPGRVNVTCSVEALYVSTDSAQAKLISSVKSNTQVTVELYRWDTSASAYAASQSATATITNITIVHTDGEAATFSAEFDIDGDFSA